MYSHPQCTYDQLRSQGVNVTDKLIIYVFKPGEQAYDNRFAMEPSMTFDNWQVLTQQEKEEALLLLIQVLEFRQKYTYGFHLDSRHYHLDPEILMLELKNQGITLNQLEQDFSAMQALTQDRG